MTTGPTSHASEQEHKPPGKWPWIVGIIAALILGVGIGAAGGETEPSATTADDSAEIQELRDQIADLEAERDEALDALAESSVEEEPAADEPAADDPEAEPQEASEAGTQENPLPLGAVAEVGPDYELAVTSVRAVPQAQRFALATCTSAERLCRVGSSWMRSDRWWLVHVARERGARLRHSQQRPRGLDRCRRRRPPRH